MEKKDTQGGPLDGQGRPPVFHHHPQGLYLKGMQAFVWGAMPPVLLAIGAPRITFAPALRICSGGPLPSQQFVTDLNLHFIQ